MSVDSDDHPQAVLEAMTLLRDALQDRYAPSSASALTAATERLRARLGDDATAHGALLWAMTHAAELSVGMASKAYDLDPDTVLDHLTAGLRRVDTME